MLKDHADTALSLLAEVLTQSTFPRWSSTSSSAASATASSAARTTPAGSRSAFAQAVYGDRHPYGRFDTTAAALTAMTTRANVMAFHRQRYLAGNMMLVVVGDLTPAQLDPIVNRTMGAVPRGSPRRPRSCAAAADRASGGARAPAGLRAGVIHRQPSLAAATTDYDAAHRHQPHPRRRRSARLFAGPPRGSLAHLRRLRAALETTSTTAPGRGGARCNAVTGDAMQAFFTHINCSPRRRRPTRRY